MNSGIAKSQPAIVKHAPSPGEWVGRDIDGQGNAAVM